MCGRYVQTMPADAMRELFRTAGALPNLAPSWNVAPTQSAPVVRRHPETGERHLDPLRWGLRPRWAKAEKGAREPIDARGETVATNGMFRQAYAKRRCLVPAVAFYEWKVQDGGKRSVAIAPTSGEAMAFAGHRRCARHDVRGRRVRAAISGEAGAGGAVPARRAARLGHPAEPTWIGKNQISYVLLIDLKS